MKKVQFKHWKCNLVSTEYKNGRTALLLEADNTGAPVAVASVNVPGEPCPEGHTFIKDWSENEGIARALEEAGAIKLTGRKVPVGFVHALEAKLLNLK